jgi:hypothetical protein
MRIGIVKPTKKIYFFENIDDHASWSPEIVNVAKLFAKHGHDVYIMTDTDYDNSCTNIFIWKDQTPLDKIFVFNGFFKDAEDERTQLIQLEAICSDINYIVSDMRLMTYYPDRYTKIFTQSKRWHTYCAMQEATLLDEMTHSATYKTIPYYFGGTERGRTKDFMEYIVQPGCTWVGKSETLDIVNYIPHYKHLENLQKAKTTIIIADEVYNAYGFVNDRYYECAKYDVICFADSKFDPDEIIMKKDDWRRVSSHAELVKKQKELDDNPQLYRELLLKQRIEIESKRAGDSIYSYLME